MLYRKLVERITAVTRVSEDSVRRVLQALPDVIMECVEDEHVKTPLGVFRVVRRKRKRVKDPQGRWTFSPERLEARVRPGKRMQKVTDPDASEPSPAEDEDPDPDPDLDEDLQA